MDLHGRNDLEIEAFAQTRLFGDAAVTIICEAYAPWAPQLQVAEDRWRRAMPEADQDGAIPLDFVMACVRIGSSIVLIDPGFEKPSSPWERQRAMDWKGLVRTPGLFAWMDSHGIRTDQVTHVLITHIHHDHYAGIATRNEEGRHVLRFPNARHFLGRRDWDESAERHDPSSEFSVRLGAVDRAGLLERVDSDTCILPEITMMPAPGETPGHCIVKVRSRNSSFYYLSDLFHHSCEVEHPDWVSIGRDPVAMRESRDRLFEASIAEDATLVYAHHPFPGWGRIGRTETGFVWERLP